MQRSLHSLLSGKVKYYVGKLSVALILLSMKLQETFGHVPLEDRTKNALEQYICLLVSQEQPLEILLG